MVKPQARVLVIRGGAIGDFILTLPAIRLLRENFSSCHLEVLGYLGIADLAVSAGLADATRSLNNPRMALLFARGATIDPELAGYFSSFNLVISYLYDPDGILRGNLERIGVKTLIDMPERITNDAGHASAQLARPLQKLALFLEEPQWRQPVFPTGEKSARIALHLGSGSESKNWPMEHWQRLISLLQKNDPLVQIACVTGEAEEARGTAFDRSADVSLEHWHALPLTELATRLSGCALFLGHDSGISHLASTCGVPSILLFGPTDPAIWAPPQTTIQVLQAPGGDIKQLPFEAVWEIVRERLSQADAA
jgi:heptosyltransferase-3